MRNRTAGRELALKFLFMLDLRGAEVREELSDFLVGTDASNEARGFAKILINGYFDRAAEIDHRIDDAAVNWDLKRMAAVDRNILRVAAFELLGDVDTPAKVVINEAIEIGKKYGSAKSASFINGILDRIRRSDESGAESETGSETASATETEIEKTEPPKHEAS